MRITKEKIIEFGKFRLDAANKVLRHNGETVVLPKKSVEVLCSLIENRGKVISKQDILSRI
ncbi:MAG: hypothetical protein H7Z37_02940 [Pyrinomonadaceae bacterium]|nr:hypothetical protein [Pyrinomonadaceae bacterium]